MGGEAYVLTSTFDEPVATTALRTVGLQPRQFSEPAALIDALYRHRPTLVCLDTHASTQDPYELVRQIRPRAPLVPMLVLTAPEDDLSKETFLELGADDCSIRTVNPRVLAARTRRLIERCAQRGSSAHNSGQYEISSVDVRTLAHELKNELHPLRMLVSMLEDPTEPHAELLPLMRRAVERMCNQIDGILDHNSVVDTDGTQADLSSVCANCCSMFQSAYRDRSNLSVTFQSTFAAGEAMLDIRASVLHQIISNLVGNAIDAFEDISRENARVWLQADINWSVAMIRVGDNGPGITQEIRAHMFERDFTTKGDNGSGIGLAVVQQMVRNLGGDIDVVSDPGRGTVVTVALPIR